MHIKSNFANFKPFSVEFSFFKGKKWTIKNLTNTIYAG
ncbi:hypothetical protein CHAB381_0883 [Campylobacter hominis ATCC BAA-381]|uniref:Uncharacterized protein n=1 Tax=Campylobacter hominis (strain ATCC BAA-381 / DSM 21671 / CCUG 45161 / LMG 19568 / NCTC 13146 / CH001A) TaxID=360107 RepID=A7I1Q4_CAMHC|nr:hypothetical protein CHAB381_0883 [Campylobacter hominis ATCC BAA-381]